MIERDDSIVASGIFLPAAERGHYGLLEFSNDDLVASLNTDV